MQGWQGWSWQGKTCRGLLRRGEACRGDARLAGLVVAWRGLARRCGARQGWLVRSRLVPASAKCVVAGRGKAGLAWRGMALSCQSWVRQSKAGAVWRGGARLCAAMSGGSRQGWRCFVWRCQSRPVPGSARLAVQGAAVLGARLSSALASRGWLDRSRLVALPAKSRHGNAMLAYLTEIGERKCSPIFF